MGFVGVCESCSEVVYEILVGEFCYWEGMADFLKGVCDGFECGGRQWCFDGFCFWWWCIEGVMDP